MSKWKFEHFISSSIPKEKFYLEVNFRVAKQGRESLTIIIIGLEGFFLFNPGTLFETY